MHHGELRQALGPGDIDVYSFTDPAEKVYADMKGDLDGRGWTLRYRDDVAAVFMRTDQGVEQEARFYFYRAWWRDPLQNMSNSGEPTTTTCVACLPKVSNWASDLIAQVDEWRKPAKAPSQFAPDLTRDAVDFTCKVIGPKEVEVMWRNRTDDPVRVSVDDMQIDGYDTDRVPVKETVPALSRMRSVVGFPRNIGVPRGTPVSSLSAMVPLMSGGDIGYSIRSAAGDPEDLIQMTGVEPDVRLEGSEIVIANDKPRAFELRALEIDVDGKQKYVEGGTQVVGPGKNLRIAVPQGKVILVTGNYRLRPNIRWRSLTVDLP